MDSAINSTTTKQILVRSIDDGINGKLSDVGRMKCNASHQDSPSEITTNVMGANKKTTPRNTVHHIRLKFFKLRLAFAQKPSQLQGDFLGKLRYSWVCGSLNFPLRRFLSQLRIDYKAFSP
jgi:hypothetical protein